VGALVSGTIAFAPGGGPVRDAAVRVKVEEIHGADAPARPAGSTVLEHVSLDTPAGTAGIPFTVWVETVDPAADYNVRVHVDVGGTGRIGPEDYLSTSSERVLTHGNPSEAHVVVRPTRR
jgi:hypothetical protein